MEGARSLQQLLHRITQLLKAFCDAVTSGLAFFKADINTHPVKCLLACLSDDISKGSEQRQGNVNPCPDVVFMASKDQELQALSQSLAMLKLEAMLS